MSLHPSNSKRVTSQVQYATTKDQREVIDDYFLSKKLGEGSWGICFQAFRRRSEEAVTLRILSKDFGEREIAFA